MAILFSAELRYTGTAHHFSYLLNTSDYRILRMDEDHDRMYVGSKDYILSLDLHDINKEPLIVSPSPPLTSPVLSGDLQCNPGLRPGAFTAPLLLEQAPGVTCPILLASLGHAH